MQVKPRKQRMDRYARWRIWISIFTMVILPPLLLTQFDVYSAHDKIAMLVGLTIACGIFWAAGVAIGTVSCAGVTRPWLRATLRTALGLVATGAMVLCAWIATEGCAAPFLFPYLCAATAVILLSSLYSQCIPLQQWQLFFWFLSSKASDRQYAVVMASASVAILAGFTLVVVLTAPAGRGSLWVAGVTALFLLVALALAVLMQALPGRRLMRLFWSMLMAMVTLSCVLLAVLELFMGLPASGLDFQLAVMITCAYMAGLLVAAAVFSIPEPAFWGRVLRRKRRAQ